MICLLQAGMDGNPDLCLSFLSFFIFAETYWFGKVFVFLPRDEGMSRPVLRAVASQLCIVE